jgi:cytidylate kinase
MASLERRRERRIGQKEFLSKQSLVITIDGQTGSGKWALAMSLAKEYGLTFINTGTTIRALSLLAIEQGIVRTNETNVVGIPADFSQRIIDMYDRMPQKIQIAKPTDGDPTARVKVGDRDMLDALTAYNKQMAIENLSSIIASSPQMRERLYILWREAATELGGVVVVGRKTGVDLFPNAHLKVFLQADPGASALYRENLQIMATEHVDKETAYVQRRDIRDRASGLLDQAEKALVIDTSEYIKDGNGLAKLTEFVRFHLDSKYILR